MSEPREQPLTEVTTQVTLPNGKQLLIVVEVMSDLSSRSRAELLPEPGDDAGEE